MKDLRPATAREALFQVRLEVVQPILSSETSQRIDRICREGLDLSAMSNFELTDQLADRLAEAHGLLRETRDRGVCDSDKLARVLALPPDIEAMMDRRLPR